MRVRDGEVNQLTSVGRNKRLFTFLMEADTLRQLSAGYFSYYLEGIVTHQRPPHLVYA